MTMEDIRFEGQSDRIDVMLMAVVVASNSGKEFRLPTPHEILCAKESYQYLENTYSTIPFGIPNEVIKEDAKRNTWCVQYGLNRFKYLFTDRQLLVLGSIINYIRTILEKSSAKYLYPKDWTEAILCYLACALDKVADYNSTLVNWQPQGGKGANTFKRWALSVSWDFVENNIIESDSGGWGPVVNWVSEPIRSALNLALTDAYSPVVLNRSALSTSIRGIDVIVTDPPYYDSIGYSILMDFFYIWIRRIIYGLSIDFDQAFSSELAPKWDHETKDGELIDDASRFSGNRNLSKLMYEDGMYRAFTESYRALLPNGRLVVVFANKRPDAWETLVSAIIRSGFVVTSSWPILTEMSNRTRAHSGAALASSVWLVCRKRLETARPGWDNRVLDEMRQNIAVRLRNFWDAGIRGPDFVWAATGPALEAYSQYPVVKKANEPGQLMAVGEFLRHVRRMVVDFVVGQVLTLTPGPSPASGEGSQVDVSGLDDVTTYYLLHRHDFGFEEAPAGACILYALSCGLSDRELADRYDLLTSVGKPRSKSGDDEIEEDGDQEAEYEESSGSTLRLKGWKERKSPSLGLDPALDKSPSRLPLFPDMEIQAAPSRSLPLIDQVHRLMHLWKAGDVNKVNDYLDIRGLRRNQLFHQLLQALIELAPAGSEERVLLERISNHLVERGQDLQKLF